MTTGLFQQVAANGQGHDYVVGDIHGYGARLEQLLHEIAFDPLQDRLFAVGDFIDRGPDSAMSLRMSEQPWLHAVRGNHEQMMIDALNADGEPRPGSANALWQANGGDWSRRLAPSQLKVLRERALALPIALAIDCADGSTAGVVHAGVPGDDWAHLADLALDADPDVIQAALWSREAAYRVLRGARGGATEVAGIDRVYHGHTPMPYPVAAANTRWLDTGVFMPRGGLSLTRIDDDSVWTQRRDAEEQESGWDEI